MAANAQVQNGFLDSIWARMLALLLALLLGFILLYNFGDELRNHLAGNSGTEQALPDSSASAAPQEAANPALAQCLQQRIGDVDRMKEEGILSDAQYASFRTRAEELCLQQNPG